MNKMLNIHKQFGRARVEKKLSLHRRISDFKEETHTPKTKILESSIFIVKW